MFRRSRKPSGHTVEPLTAGEVQWRDRHIRVAGEMAEAVGGNGDPLPSLADLDTCVEVFVRDRHSRGDTLDFANVIGLALGVHLARDTGLEWVLATEGANRDLALHRTDGDVLVYPAASVFTRLLRRESGFVVPLHAALVQSIAGISA